MEQSLVKAMAGPSSGKAGLAKDQTEINRIIAEASKNSKFFQEAKRKDVMLTERIRRLIKMRDDIMPAVDIAQAEARVDQMINDLEQSRDLSRVIVHVDLDAFYASVEELDDPSLKGKPFGVGHGVLTTANYAARQFGCRSGMATFVAKKLCPHLIIVSNHFSRYVDMSNAVMDILATYDPDLCKMGADEAYLTINDYCSTHNLTPEECVRQMREEVHQTTKLTCSAGIAANRRLAKICSDKNKPNGQYCLPSESQTIIDFMRDLPLRKIPGIGRVTERVLTELGIPTCGDVYTHRAMIAAMDKHLGLRSLLEAYLGLGSNVVEPPAREERRSVGVETTFSPLGDKEKLLEKLDHIAEELEEDMKRTQWAGRTITLKYKLDTFQTFTRARTLPRYVSSKADILPVGRDLFLREWPLRLRLIGIRVSTLKDLRPKENGIEKFFGKPASISKPQSHGQFQVDAQRDPLDSFLVDESFEAELSHPPPGSQPLEDDEEDLVSWSPTPPRELTGYQGSSLNTMDLEAEVQTLNQGRDNTDDHDGPSTSLSKPRSRSHPVKPVSSSSHHGPESTSKQKSKHRSVSVPSETQTCPNCAKMLGNVDNASLNAHLDYCLSREAISEVASGANGSRDGPKKRKRDTEREGGVSSKGKVKMSKGKAKGGTSKKGGLYDFGVYPRGETQDKS